MIRQAGPAIEKNRTALEGRFHIRNSMESVYWIGQDPVNMEKIYDVAGSEAGSIFASSKAHSQ